MIIGIYGIQDIKLSDFPEFVHDHSIAVIKDGICIHHMQLERYTNHKYDNRMPVYLYDLLHDLKIAGKEDVELVFVDNVLGRSFISFKGDIRFESPLAKKLATKIETGQLRWYGKEKQAFILNHELAHVFSCLPFYGIFKENSLLIHFDGGASKGNFSAWIWKNNDLKLIECSWRLKYLSNLFNANALTFMLVGGNSNNQHAVPGKFMGLAAYGQYSAEIEDWLKENNYFENIWGKPQVFKNAVQQKFGIELPDIDNKIKLLQDIAATFQTIFERDFLTVLNELKQKYQTDYLYYTGGSALNIALNSKIAQSGMFRDVFIPPCTNDTGLALGAASCLQYQKGKSMVYHTPFLNNLGAEDLIRYTEKDIKKTASLIAQGAIIAVCNGPSEIGPRALGNRSILCRADSKVLSQKVSMQIKGREWYRPVAPVMLEKNARYFTGLKSIHHLSRYMLLEFMIDEDKSNELEGAVHINNTARIQTIFHREDSPFIYDLLQILDQEYSIRALINTSFNVQGKPIVQRAEDARVAAQNMGLNAVVINGDCNILNETDNQL